MTVIFVTEGQAIHHYYVHRYYALFSRDHYDGMRMQCRELSRDELDLVLLGQIAPLLANNSDTIAPKPLPRQCSSMAFYHGGVQICRNFPETAWNRYYSIIHDTYVHVHT